MSQRYSYSELKLFLECAKKYEYTYEQDWEPVFDGVALPLGKAIHCGVEVMAKGGSKHEALDSALDIFTGEQPDTDDEKVQEKFIAGDAQIRAMIRDYPLWDGRVEIVAVEQKLECPMPFGRTYVGTVDLICRVNGDLWVWDTKTTGDPIDKAAKNNRIRLQYPGYALLVEHWLKEKGEPEDVKGVMIDLIHKPRVYIRKDGTHKKLEPLYHREPMLINRQRTDAFTAWFSHVAQMVELNRGAKNSQGADLGDDELAGSIVPGAWPMNDGSCSKWGRTCPFFEACRNPDRALTIIEGSSMFKKREERYPMEEEEG